MKTGKTLKELAVEVERQANSKKDFVASTNQLTVVENEGANGSVGLLINGIGGFGVTDTCHEQLATTLDIPKAYYDRMRGNAPQLLCENTNHWLQNFGKKRMVRTLDGQARAFLSDTYRPLDNVDLMEAALPIIQDHKWEIKSCELTDRKLYIKVVSQQLTAKIDTDHVNVRHGGVTHIVHPGLVIANSEVGMGRVVVTPSLHWEHCLNLAQMDEAGYSRIHIGKRDDRFGEIAQEFFRDATRMQDDKALWMKIRDIISASINEDVFKRMVTKFQEATDAQITGDVVKVVEVTAKRYNLNETERSSVLKHLIQDGDLSAYGLSGAITRMSQEVEDYDRANELERLGGNVIELSKQDWQALASVN